MRAARFLPTLVLSLIVASSVFAQGQSPLPQGTPSEEALRRLAAQLGGPQGQGFPKLTPEQLEQLKTFAENPAFRKLLEQKIRDDPKLMQQLRDVDPNLAKQVKDQLPPELRQDPPRPPNPGEGKWPPQDKGGRHPGDPPFPPTNFPNKPNPAENREFQEVAKLWEQSVGPLDDTPAVRQALLDMFSGAANGKPGEKPFWADWDLKDPKGSQNSSFAKWLQGLSGGTGNQKLQMPKWLGKGTATNIKAPSMKLPTGPKMPSFGFGGLNFGVGSVSGLGTVGIVLVILAVTVLFAFLLWKFAPQLGLSKARSPKPLPGLGPWPIDPRTIADRGGLIKAFEYMSVLLCGDGARVWNHATIAEALCDSVPTAAPFADPLAKLYALARYTPLSEELSSDAISEARGYLCQLAGVPAP